MNRRFVSLLLILCLALPPVLAAGEAVPEEYADEAFDGTLRIREGLAQPMLAWSDLRDPDYSNEDSDILRFCVWVETDHDTDGDGKADLVRALVQVPRGPRRANSRPRPSTTPPPTAPAPYPPIPKAGRRSCTWKNPLITPSFTGKGKSASPPGK